MFDQRSPNQPVFWAEMAIHLIVLLAVLFQLLLVWQTMHRFYDTEVFTLPPVVVSPS